MNVVGEAFWKEALSRSYLQPVQTPEQLVLRCGMEIYSMLASCLANAWLCFANAICCRE